MSTRFIHLVGCLIVLLILSASLIMQYGYGILPCPLCVLQRIAFGLIGVLFLMGIFCYRLTIITRIINLLSLIVAGFGIFASGRQVWLQYFPNQSSNECGVSLQYMLQALPLNQVAEKIFSGSAECTQRGFAVLGLSMAEWALVWFVALFCMTFYLLMKK